MHRHDYRTHTCKKGPVVGKVKYWKDDELVETDEDDYPWMMVDGGLDYIRRGGDPQHYRSLDVYGPTEIRRWPWAKKEDDNG